ncbi:hypothetical protein R1sor_010205 [Riccia sorocarpa]|uniref:Xyloglucan endotransglucosylase/hydrolase n=1 Tax=Riccia sorocarpa TaxID=122646 RepID=A0ABD3HZA7_9MARC
MFELLQSHKSMLKPKKDGTGGSRRLTIRMDSSLAHVFFCLAVFIHVGKCSAGEPFASVFTTKNWGNIVTDDSTGNVQAILTRETGVEFETMKTYLGGSFSVKAKLVPGNSAGTVSAFYLISYDNNHDEIDMEFLGNVSGQPYVLHTNLFANGVGKREQQVYLTFDPTANYHTYSIIWNHRLITWSVDGTPIRVHKNIEAQAPGSFPFSKGLHVAGCIYEGSTWATRGGRDPINWNDAPFVVNFQNFDFDACEVQNGDASSCRGNYGNWWDGPQYQSLSSDQINQLRSYRQQYQIYDYCTDKSRNPTPPIECQYNEP